MRYFLEKVGLIVFFIFLLSIAVDCGRKRTSGQYTQRMRENKCDGNSTEALAASLSDRL